jgi:hypothetical protein
MKEHLFFATFSSYLMEIIWLASSLYLDFPSRLHPTEQAPFALNENSNGSLTWWASFYFHDDIMFLPISAYYHFHCDLAFVKLSSTTNIVTSEPIIGQKNVP